MLCYAKFAWQTVDELYTTWQYFTRHFSSAQQFIVSAGAWDLAYNEYSSVV
jgi:hypothetical protein